MSYAYDAPASGAATIYSQIDQRSPPVEARQTVSASQLHNDLRRPAGNSSAQARSRYLRYVYDASSTLASSTVDQLAVGGRVSTLLGAHSVGLRSDVATKGGANAVRVGQAGESAVRSAFDIGPKVTRVVDGRTRIFGGLNDVAISEVKNVKYQAYTQQLKDSVAYAQQKGLRFDLNVRGGANPTTLSGPLEAAIRNGDIGLRYIL